MKVGDMIFSKRAEQAVFLNKIVHRMRADLQQLFIYQHGGIVPDEPLRRILESVHSNLFFFLNKKFAEQKQKEKPDVRETPD